MVGIIRMERAIVASMVLGWSEHGTGMVLGWGEDGLGMVLGWSEHGTGME